MYSRYHGGAEREIRVPENYSGSAFADAPRDTVWASPSRAIEVAKPSPPAVDPPKPRTDAEEIKIDAEPPAAETVMPTVSEKHGAPPALLKKTRFLESIGFEELLLLGLILLLSQSGADSETLLWLGLLLLWG